MNACKVCVCVYTYTHNMEEFTSNNAYLHKVQLRLEFLLEFWNSFPAYATSICLKNYFTVNRVCSRFKI